MPGGALVVPPHCSIPSTYCWNKREGKHNLECTLASLLIAMDECLLLLPANAPFMPNVPPSKLSTPSA
ncbi:hypothetical protein CMV_005056 [Castanea mollissima]|uniref:Uncharacterized protein n=1 Tax=Castanea mollissima TaxID=60419 RepID=A0A8J4VUP3_9ROSI|nr:hypothetical protein CMV_005056 [Castanea mollissima]